MVTKAKAKKILKDGKIRGKKLTNIIPLRTTKETLSEALGGGRDE